MLVIYMKYFYLISGCIAVALGAVGVLVPGLPTTPFVLLASWCFYRSSPRLRERLLKSFLGQYIRAYERDKGLTVRKKAYIIASMSVMVGFSAGFLIDSPAIRLIVIIAGIIGGCVVGFVVPTSRQQKNARQDLSFEEKS